MATGEELGGPIRHAAVRRLGLSRRRTVPYVQQLQWADCGAACLAMVAGYHGKTLRLDDARSAMGTGRDGTSALAIVRAAGPLGLRARAVKLEVEDLSELPRASILHWDFNHFVVFDRLAGDAVLVIDPARGRRRVSMDQVRRSLTGIALVFEPNETFRPSAAGRSPLWNYLGQLFAQRPLLMRLIVTSGVLRLLALALPMATALVVDTVLPRADDRLLLVVAIGAGTAIGFQVLFDLIRGHFLLALRTRLDLRLTLDFLDHLVSLPYAFFQRRSAGDLIARVSSNTTIRETLTASTLSALLDGSLVFAYLIIMVAIHPKIAMLTIALAGLQITVYLLARRRTSELMREDLAVQARCSGSLVEMLHGIETLKLAGCEREAVSRWSDLLVDGLNVGLRRGRLQAVVDALMRMLQAGSPLLILCVGAVEVMTGQLSLGLMLALNALAVGFLTPLSSLVDSGLKLQQLGSYIERLDDVLSADLEQVGAATVASPTLTGRITVRSLAFRYDASSPLVIENVDLDVEPGTCLAIVGASGSGKSTLAALLLGLYRPTHGMVCYDGCDLASLDLRRTRQQIGIVPQHPFVFGRSVRANVALGNPSIPMHAIETACRAAAIHDEIVALPMGYDTIVGESGASLSGGQRQRLAIARALVGKPRILLLDEATSSLDAATERRVMDNLARLRCVRLVIAHRLSTVASADRIVVMDKGRIAQVGPHDQLAAVPGVYRDLVLAQGWSVGPAPPLGGLDAR